MSFEGSYLRGEKWSHLMTPEEIAKDKGSKGADVKIYLEENKRIAAEKEKDKPKSTVKK